MITQQFVAEVRETFEQAAREFNFTFVSPFEIAKNSKKYCAFGYISEYGSPNGVIIHFMAPPNYELDKDVYFLAKELSCYYSFINFEAFLCFNKTRFSDMLKDWGRFM